jgi:hypothetical protein
MQGETGEGCLDVDAADAGVANIFLSPVRKQISKRPEEVMQTNVDGDEIDRMVLVRHVN